MGKYSELMKKTFNDDKDNKVYSRKELYKCLKDANGGKDPGINPWLPSDYCYNRYNKDLDGFEQRLHLFEYLGYNKYRILGPEYKYDGEVFNNGKVVGKWKNGKFE